MIPAAQNFFSGRANTLDPVILWLAAVILLTTPFALLWTARDSRWPWRAVVAVVASCVPPLVVIGYASPIYRRRNFVSGDRLARDRVNTDLRGVCQQESSGCPTRRGNTDEHLHIPIGQTAKLLRLHISEGDLYNGKPLYQAIVEKCREVGIAGATVFRGLEGYGETAEIHRHHLVKHDQPIVISIVDQPDALLRLMPIVEEMIDTGLIAMSDVKVIRVQKSVAPQHV